MNTQEYALSVLLTALGGFDPAPMLILAAALGAGIRKRHIMGSAAVLLGGTAAWGMTLTLLVGPGLQRVNWGNSSATAASRRGSGRRRRGRRSTAPAHLRRAR